MIISIPKEYGKDFVRGIINKFIFDIKLKLIVTDFRILDLWLQVDFDIPKDVTCQDVILYALENAIELNTFNTEYNITFSNTKTYPGTTIRLITLLKAINYGNRYYKGNPIIVDECKQLNTDLSNLYENYRFMGVVI